MFRFLKGSLRLRSYFLYGVLVFVFFFKEGYAQNFLPVATSDIPALTNARAEWVDFNNDNLPDLFISGTTNRGSFHTSVYLNNGDDTFNVISLAALGEVAVDFEDYNKDSFIDMIIAGVNGSGQKETILYKNISGGGFTIEPTSFEPLSRGAILWEDLDSDADADLILTGLDVFNEERTLIYEYINDTYVAINHSLPPLSNGKLLSLDANNDNQREIIISGLNSNGSPTTEIYTWGNKNISKYGQGIPGIAFNSIATIDFNFDGFEDLVISGLTGDSFQNETLQLQNNRTNDFTVVSHSMIDVSSSSLATGDLNNDGLTDIVLSGIDDQGFKHCKYYQNTPTFLFTNVSHSMPNIYNGDVALSDYDQDGDLDIFQIGNSDISFQANLFVSDNAETKPNSAPAIPANLRVTILEDSVYFSWDVSLDEQTVSNSITYNLYVSKEPNGVEMMVSPLSDLTSGYHRLNNGGNAGYKRYKSFKRFPEGKYYWSVQAIDNGFKASGFANEQTFSVCYSIDLGSDTTICYKDTVYLSIGNDLDEVSWYSKTGGQLLSDTNHFYYTVEKTDTIIVSLTKQYGCTVRDTLTVKLSQAPIIDLGLDRMVCYGENANLSISYPYDSVAWYNMNTSFPETRSELSYTVFKQDTIIGAVFNSNKCVAYDSVIVGVLPLPEFSVGSDRSVCYRDSTLFDISGVWETINWYSSSDGILSANSNSYFLSVLKNDTVFAEVKDVNGCLNYDSAVVEVLPLPAISLGPDKSVCSQDSTKIALEGNGIAIQWYDAKRNHLATDETSYSFQVIQNDTISIKVTAENSCISYDSVIVNLIPLPQFTLGNDTSVCFGKSLLLRAGTGFKEVDWISKKNGDTLNTNWFYNYKVALTDTLIASVVNQKGCRNYDSIFIEVISLPAFTLGRDTTVCFSQNVNLQVPGAWTNVNWYTNDDVILAKNQHSISFSAQDSKSLWVDVFNVHGCIQSDTVRVNVLAPPEFDLGSEKVHCVGDMITMEVPEFGYSYQWTNAVNDLLSQNSIYIFEGKYSGELFLTATDSNYCVHRDSVYVKINSLPSFNIQGDSVICEGESVNLSIDFPNYKDIRWYQGNVGNSLLFNGDQIDLKISESTTLFALLKDQNDCSSTRPHPILVNQRPGAYAGPDTLLCYGGTVILGEEQIEAGYSFQWSPAIFLNDSHLKNPIALPESSITYELKVTNSENCTNLDSVFIAVSPRIIVDAGTSTGICIGDSIQLGGNPTASGIHTDYFYHWVTGVEPADQYMANPIVKPVTTTIYHLVVSNQKCGTQYDSVQVLVHPLPFADVIADQSIGVGEAVALYASGGLQYSWTPQQSLDDPFSAFPMASPLLTTTYTVRVLDFNSCSDTASVTVIVQNKLFIPNLFTPNDDQANDVFKLYGSGVEKIKLSIFDLNGNKIFHAENVEEAFEQGWDGTSEGKQVKDDIYIWTISGTFFNGEDIKFEGNNSGILRLMR